MGSTTCFGSTFRPFPERIWRFLGGVNAVSYDPTTGIFSGVGDPRRSGYALGPWAVAEVKENP